jgi:hypothetical protein
MKRVIMLLTVALVMALMMVASVMPAFAQGRGEGPQGVAQGPEGGNPGQGPSTTPPGQGDNPDEQPLPFGGTEPEAGFENAPPGLVCTAPGSPFHPPEGC